MVTLSFFEFLISADYTLKSWQKTGSDSRDCQVIRYEEEASLACTTTQDYPNTVRVPDARTRALSYSSMAMRVAPCSRHVSNLLQ